MVDQETPQVSGKPIEDRIREAHLDHTVLTMTMQEAEQLVRCLDRTYISHDDYPRVIALLRRIREIVDIRIREIGESDV